MSSHKGGQAAQAVQFLLIAGETEAQGDSDLFTVTQGGCCKGRNGNPILQPPTWKTLLLFLPLQATYPHPLELCICLPPTPPGHCPTLEGCKWSPSFVDLGSLTAQQGGGTAQRSPAQKFPLPGHHSRGEGDTPGNPAWHFWKGRQKVCLFFFRALEAL